MITSDEASTPQEYTDLIEDMMSHNQSLLYLTDRLKSRLHTADGRNEIIRGSNGNSSQVNPLEIEGTMIICRLMKLRLLFALDPARFSAMEVESQILANQIMCFDKQLSKDKEGRVLGGLFMSQTTWIARATIETYDMWKTAAEGKGMIAKWKFEAWCCAMGRRINV
jgi:hypothetical protein